MTVVKVDFNQGKILEEKTEIKPEEKATKTAENQCFHCRQRVKKVPEDLHILFDYVDDSSAESGFYCCPHCNEKWRDKHVFDPYIRSNEFGLAIDIPWDVLRSILDLEVPDDSVYFNFYHALIAPNKEKMRQFAPDLYNYYFEGKSYVKPEDKQSPS
jgi:hypothetical protein